jgi:tetratricopeptide (TPR) repeat protein
MMDLLDQAVALHGQGRLAEAERLYGQILAANPGHLDAWHMLGVLKAQQGKPGEAHDLIAPVVAARPHDALALANLGNVLNDLERLAEALRAYDRSLAIDSNYPPAWCNRGNVLKELNRLDEALASYERALALAPDFPPALNNRANVLLKLGRLEEALAGYDQALALDPGYAEAHANRGDVLQRLCRYDEALAAYQQALAIAPEAPLTWNSRGVALVQLGRLEEARQSYARGAALAPDMPEIRLNQGVLHLLEQDFAKGWPLFEARKEMPDLGEARSFDQPLWTGAQEINGKTVFVYIRRGLGDAIQFYRYAALAQARGARVVLSVNDPLLPLLQSALPQVSMIGLGQVPEAFDYHISLMSLPLALGGGIPQTGRYLSAEPARVAAWRARIGGEGYRIAVSWQGDAVTMGAEGKSFALSALAGIAAIPGVRLISLQRNAGSEQLGQPGMRVETFPGFDEGPGAFLDSAAIMENCDLVISCDTALAHLAGALGVPAWIALKHVPEWRWFLNRGDSPWYPSLRLFRQPANGDWDSVFRAMEAEIISRPLTLNKP